MCASCAVRRHLWVEWKIRRGDEHLFDSSHCRVVIGDCKFAAGVSWERMEHMLGLLRVRVIRGRNLAVRDMFSSDPYVVLKMGKVVRFLGPLFFFFVT